MRVPSWAVLASCFQSARLLRSLSGILTNLHLNFILNQAFKISIIYHLRFLAGDRRQCFLVLYAAVHIWEGMQSFSPYCLIRIASIYWELSRCQGIILNILHVLINFLIRNNPYEVDVNIVFISQS